MDLTLRPAQDDDELREMVAIDTYAFGYDATEDLVETARDTFPLERSWCAFDAGRMVGISANIPLTVTVPGGGAVPMAGVTWVSVLTTHRRRGVLTALMSALLDDAEAHGELVAGLTASEGAIYGRFGYGVATSAARVAVDRRTARLRVDDGAAGTVDLVDGAAAQRELPGAFDRYRAAQPGEVTRTEGMWRNLFRDPELERDGHSKLRFALHRAPGGEVDGFASWRIKEVWEPGPASVLAIRDLVGAPGARADLWRFLLDVDLVATVKDHRVALDDPMRWRFEDPRSWNVVGVDDHLWLRLVDVPAALSARRYGVSGRLVLDVVDRFRPRAGGRFVLDASGDATTCTATDATADLRVPANALGAAYLGGVSWRALAAAGLVDEETPGALERAARLFGTDPAPFATTGF